MKWYQVDVGYACYGIRVSNNTVLETAPIAKWMIGKSFIFIKEWVKKKQGTIKEVK